MKKRNNTRTPRRGFTLVEMLIAMVIAMVVVTSAMAFTVTSYEARRHWTIREGVDRDARFVGMSLARDAQEAGVAIITESAAFRRAVAPHPAVRAAAVVIAS